VQILLTQLAIKYPVSFPPNWFSSYSRKCRGCFFGTQWATSLFDLDFAEPFRWAKAKAEC